MLCRGYFCFDLPSVILHSKRGDSELNAVAHSFLVPECDLEYSKLIVYIIRYVIVVTMHHFPCSFCFFYLRQVNEVNSGDNAFVRCVCLSVCVFVCLCVRSGRSMGV